jgi:hypothetical protein
VAGEFKLSYAYLGPTEMRLLAILASIWVYFHGARFITLLSWKVSFFELILLGISILLYSAFFLSTVSLITQLARIEPPLSDPLVRPEKNTLPVGQAAEKQGK